MGVFGVVQGMQPVIRQSPYRLGDCLRSVEVAGDRESAAGSVNRGEMPNQNNPARLPGAGHQRMADQVP
jgi:hypothetical protein